MRHEHRRWPSSAWYRETRGTTAVAIRGLALALALFASGCAGRTGTLPGSESARERLDRGLAALHRDDYRGGLRDLAWVYERCYPRTAGQEALLVMAAVELDPRNPYRRLDVGSELAARFLERPGPWSWARPVAEALYLVGSELRGSADDSSEQPAPGMVRPASAAVPPAGPPAGLAPAASDCGALPPDADARTIALVPTLPVPPVADYLDRVRRDQRALITRADSLESHLQSLQAQLAAKEQELERIRQTLKP